jgi:hypothetical protein
MILFIFFQKIIIIFFGLNFVPECTDEFLINDSNKPKNELKNTKQSQYKSGLIFLKINDQIKRSRV